MTRSKRHGYDKRLGCVYLHDQSLENASIRNLNSAQKSRPLQ